MLAGVFYCKNLAFQSPLPESRSDEDAIHIPYFLLQVGAVKMLALNRVDVHLALVGGTGVDERLKDGFVGVLKFDIFPDKGYVYLMLRII